MFGKKRRKADQASEIRAAHQRHDDANQAYISKALNGEHPAATQAAADQTQAALADIQKLVNPQNKSTRKKKS